MYDDKDRPYIRKVKQTVLDWISHLWDRGLSMNYSLIPHFLKIISEFLVLQRKSKNKKSCWVNQ